MSVLTAFAKKLTPNKALIPPLFQVSSRVVDNRSEPKKVKSILKHNRTVVPCDSAWLPEVGLHLAVPLESVREHVIPINQVWFPEDVAGEPHPKNPDDGCGGAKYKLTSVHEFPKFKKNYLEKRSKNQSDNAYRWLSHQIRDTNLINFNRKMFVWVEFQKRMNKITHPEYGYLGLGWRALFRKSPRIDE